MGDDYYSIPHVFRIIFWLQIPRLHFCYFVFGVGMRDFIKFSWKYFCSVAVKLLAPHRIQETPWLKSRPGNVLS